MRAALVDERPAAAPRSAPTAERGRRAGRTHRAHRRPSPPSAATGRVPRGRRSPRRRRLRGGDSSGRRTCRSAGPICSRRTSCRRVSASRRTSPTTPTWPPSARPSFGAGSRSSPTSRTSRSRPGSGPASSTAGDSCTARVHWPRSGTRSSTGARGAEGSPRTLEELGSGSGMARRAGEAGLERARRGGASRQRRVR